MNFNNIDKEILDKIDLSELSQNINDIEHRNYFISEASKEHYRLLSYISISEDNINMLDIGTFKGCSALAMSINENNSVISFDISQSFDLIKSPKNIEFVLDNILNEKYVKTIMNSKYILLDTFHDGTFELEFFNHLKKINYNGFLLLDDIFLNSEMKKFWEKIDLEKIDLTSVGHITGTGLVFFKK